MFKYECVYNIKGSKIYRNKLNLDIHLFYFILFFNLTKI